MYVLLVSTDDSSRSGASVKLAHANIYGSLTVATSQICID